MQFLDLRNKQWDTLANEEMLKRPRLDVYNKISRSFNKPYCFMPGNDNLKIVKRIGSASVNGEVYLLETPAKEYIVGKIMPIISEKSENNNKNEMEIAKKASLLVLSGQTTHFPLIYGAAHCDNTMYDNTSIFIQNSKYWWLRNQLMRAIGVKKARIEGFKYDQQTHGMTLEKKISYVKEKVPTIDLGQMELESDVLLSELAWGDLETFLQRNAKNMSNAELHQMYTTILDVIMDMQTKLHIVHRDFHSGNILVSFSDQGANLLAHDFGTSQEKKEFDLQDSLYDVDTITAKLLENHFENHPYMGPRLNSIVKYRESFFANPNPMTLIAEKWNELK